MSRTKLEARASVGAAVRAGACGRAASGRRRLGAHAAALEAGRGAGPGAATGPGGAIVLGGDYRALGVVRSLGRHGVPVWVLHGRDDRLAAVSRYASGRTAWPGCAAPDAVPFLVDLADREGLGGWALIPTNDDGALLLARHADVLGAVYVCSTPPWEVLRWAADKRLTVRLADDLGIDQPRTRVLASRADAEAATGPFPLVLKPAVKPPQDVLRVKAWRADDRASLLAHYDAAAPLVEPGSLLCQELIPGGGDRQLSFAALCRGGEARATLVARRARQYPMDFGRASTMVETIDDREVEATARRILAALGLSGLVEVEFKRDPRDGRLKLLDINPRVWGWHSIGAAAGVDFPVLLWQQLQGSDVPEVRGRPGARWARLSVDLPVVLGEILGRRLSPAAYLRSVLRPTSRAVFARDDPLPGLAEVPLLCRAAVGRLLEGRPL